MCSSDLKDGNLESDLNDAQTFAAGFQQCIATIPPFDPTTGDRGNFFRSYIKCATTVDSSLASLFPGG